MTEERPPNLDGERQSERDSQISAMFDGELPAAECELLARRLTRDEALRTQWSRYSLIGAALRGERGVALHDRVAVRVQSVVAKEATYGEGNPADVARPAAAASHSTGARRGWSRFAYPLAGASIAAGVAAVSILWLQGAQPQGDAALQASAGVTTVLAPEAGVSPNGTTVALNPADGSIRSAIVSNGEPERYTTPAPSSVSSIAPPARLANYVVAHSEFSGPLQRRMALLGIVGSEGVGEGEIDQASPDSAPVAEDNGQ
jgi:sigma-E factor negative regulatory protein RseA